MDPLWFDFGACGYEAFDVDDVDVVEQWFVFFL